MTKTRAAGGSRTIDSKGNIVPKPYGVSRWDYHRDYACTHEGCENNATKCSPIGKAHNCCGKHPEENYLEAQTPPVMLSENDQEAISQLLNKE